MERMAVFPSQRPQGQLPRHSRQLESVRRIFPLVAAVVQHHPLHPNEVRAERAWLPEPLQHPAGRGSAEEKEKRMQRAILDIKNRFGPNAVMKGTSYQDAATGIERNDSIGGHKA